MSSNFACGLSEFSKYFALGNHELGMLRIYSLSAGNNDGYCTLYRQVGTFLSEKCRLDFRKVPTCCFSVTFYLQKRE
jgi:hypothetical protein